jgi:hypothetical protein
LKNGNELVAEWKSGDAMRWVWQCPTRVSGFEVEEPAGAELVSIAVGNEEQLLTSVPVALMNLVQWYPHGVPESPDPGWKIGRLALPAQPPGVVLYVVTRNFGGRLRPFGMQVR